MGERIEAGCFRPGCGRQRLNERGEAMELAREVDRLNKQNETMRAALVVVRDYSCRCGIMGSCGCGEVMIRHADDVLDELAEEGDDDGA